MSLPPELPSGAHPPTSAVMLPRPRRLLRAHRRLARPVSSRCRAMPAAPLGPDAKFAAKSRATFPRAARAKFRAPRAKNRGEPRGWDGQVPNVAIYMSLYDLVKDYLLARHGDHH